LGTITTLVSEKNPLRKKQNKNGGEKKKRNGVTRTGKEFNQLKKGMNQSRGGTQTQKRT